MVISLVMIGFSQVSRRNQQETLDRQLNNQAFYASESGINAAISVIQGKIASGQEIPEKTECNDFEDYPDIQLDNQSVKVTCLLVETDSAVLYYDTVNENAPTIAALIPSTPGERIGKITFTWRNSSAGPNASANCFPASGANYSLPTRSNWNCGHGILRTDLTAQPSGAIDTAFSSFFYPHRTTGTMDIDTAPTADYAARGGMNEGECSDADNDPKCMASVNGLDAPIYYVNLRSIYKRSTVTIHGFNTSGLPIRFKGQVTIDVTAKAEDVIKRVQVRVPLTPQDTSTIPAYAIESSGSLCKRYSSFPGYDSDDRACP
jgi:hypothetical protein